LLSIIALPPALPLKEEEFMLYPVLPAAAATTLFIPIQLL